MDALPHGAADVAPTVADPTPSVGREGAWPRLAAAGGILGAVAASSCCIVPLILFSLGISGAWISNLTALAPYQPWFVAGTVGVLGYGFYLVHWKPRQACADGAACARPVSGRLVRSALWIATALVIAAFAFNYVAPLLLGA